MSSLTGSPASVVAPLAAASYSKMDISYDGNGDGVPTLHTESGPVRGTAAVLRYIARACGDGELRGVEALEQAQVEQWIEFCMSELENEEINDILAKSQAFLGALVNMGVRYSDRQDRVREEILAQEDFVRALTSLDTRLSSRSWLVGDHVSAADIAVFGSVYSLFSLVFQSGPGSHPFPHLQAWCDRLRQQPWVVCALRRLDLQRGGVCRQGGQIDRQPDAHRVGAAANASIARNAGKGKKKSQRDQERAKRAGDRAGDGAAAPGAGVAHAKAGEDAAAATAENPYGIVATETQPARNMEELPHDAAVEMTQSTMRDMGLSMEVYPHARADDMETLQSVAAHVPCALCKNLFIRAKKAKNPEDSRLWLVVAKADSKVDLKKLGEQLGYGKIALRFGDNASLQKNLGVTRGRVTPLALVNDTALKVNVVYDARMLREDALGFHPMSNEATAVVSPATLTEFTLRTGHRFLEMEFPVQE